MNEYPLDKIITDRGFAKSALDFNKSVVFNIHGMRKRETVSENL